METKKSERETTRWEMDPTPLCSSPLNNSVKTHSFFEFRFAAFPGKTIRLSIIGKSPATLILAGGHS